jgi:predicted Zn-dependent protease
LPSFPELAVNPSPPLKILGALACVALLITSCSGSGKSSSGRGARTVLLSEGGSTPSASRRRPVLTTRADDAQVGKEGSKGVAAQIGLIEDKELDAYVQRVARKVLRGMPRRSFEYKFAIVDQPEANAFALPGGYIFISRGLLVLMNSEDELANVIGHEITHVARRHASARQSAGSPSPLAMPWLQAAQAAAYGRDMERNADRIGQQLAAAAGYDPRGMSTFLESLKESERMMRGHPRIPSFFDSHPSSSERTAVNAVRASEMRWHRDQSLGDTRKTHLRHIDGLAIGERPEAGVFQGERFIHPDLDFQLRFPRGWETTNTNRSVGATSPKRDAIVFLTTESAEGDPKKAAEEFVAKAQAEGSVSVLDSGPVTVHGRESWRMHLEVGGQPNLDSIVTFVPYRGSTWRLTAVSPSFAADKYRSRVHSTMRSFRSLTPEQIASIRVERVRLVTAKPGETFADIGKRSNNVWAAHETAVGNGMLRNHRFKGGELVKVARKEPYKAK